MDRDHETISVRRQCELLGLNRSNVYYAPVGESEENQRLMRWIDEQYTATPFFGSRRMAAWLREYKKAAVNRKRIARLMQVMGLEAVHPGPKLSQPGEGHKIYPYLLKNVAIERVNQVWSTDITYIRLAQGFCYLVAVMDWHSRFVVSWSLSVTMEMEFCLEALAGALRRARPEIFNSDQGSQFTSERFTGELERRGISISMRQQLPGTSTADCVEDAVQDFSSAVYGRTATRFHHRDEWFQVFPFGVGQVSVVWSSARHSCSSAYGTDPFQTRSQFGHYYFAATD